VPDNVAAAGTDADNVDIDSEYAKKRNANLYAETLVNWYHADFFGEKLDEFVANHRSIMHRLQLLQVPTTVRKSRNLYRKFSPKLVKRHEFPNLVAYFKFIYDELNAAYEEEYYQQFMQGRRANRKAMFSLFPQSKDQILFTHVDTEILEWLAKKIAFEPDGSDDDSDQSESSDETDEPDRKRDESNREGIGDVGTTRRPSDNQPGATNMPSNRATQKSLWDKLFTFRKLCWLQAPKSISIKTDGVMVAISYDKSEKPTIWRKKRGRPLAPKRRKINRTGHYFSVNTGRLVAHDSLPKFGLIHIKKINSRKMYRLLKRRYKLGSKRVVGVDPGKIDAMTVARSGNPADSFRVSSAWWYYYNIIDLI
jgi:hypothetical protein